MVFWILEFSETLLFTRLGMYYHCTRLGMYYDTTLRWDSKIPEADHSVNGYPSIPVKQMMFRSLYYSTRELKILVAEVTKFCPEPMEKCNKALEQSVNEIKHVTQQQNLLKANWSMACITHILRHPSVLHFCRSICWLLLHDPFEKWQKSFHWVDQLQQIC